MKTCKHGNGKKWACPECENEKMAKLQRKLDKLRFKEQLKRIKG